MIVDSFIATGALFAAELMKPEKRHAVYFTERELQALLDVLDLPDVDFIMDSTDRYIDARDGVGRIRAKVAHLDHIQPPENSG